jgi:hypothetical protein
MAHLGMGFVRFQEQGRYVGGLVGHVSHLGPRRFVGGCVGFVAVGAHQAQVGSRLDERPHRKALARWGEEALEGAPA